MQCRSYPEALLYAGLCTPPACLGVHVYINYINYTTCPVDDYDHCKVPRLHYSLGLNNWKGSNINPTGGIARESEVAGT
jgi:hypothetical protein